LYHKTPLELLFKQKPNYTQLKIFGCLCYPWLKPYTSSKLQPKSTACIFLGYSTSQSAYKCYDPITRKLYVSRHVRFLEDTCPWRHGSKDQSITPPAVDAHVEASQTLIPSESPGVPTVPPETIITINADESEPPPSPISTSPAHPPETLPHTPQTTHTPSPPSTQVPSPPPPR